MEKKTGRIRRFTLFVLLVGIAVLVYSSISVYLVPDTLQYMFDASKVESGKDDAGEVVYTSALTTQLDAMEDIREALGDTTQAVTLGGYAAQVTMQVENAETLSAPLRALGENAFAVTERYLRSGRLFYDEELETGARVMLVDEKLALKLFRMTEVIGREVFVGENKYRVIGVLRHDRQVGERAEYFAYLPLKTVEKDGLQLDTLTLEAKPIENTGAMTAFKSVASRLSQGGTFYDLRQEKVGATMWARYLLCFAAFALLYRLLTLWLDGVRNFIEKCRARLAAEYMPRPLPMILFNVLWRGVALAVLALLAAWVFTQLIYPVYIYPEYIPAVLVEPEEIATTFWNVQMAEGEGIFYRTMQKARIVYFTGLCRWGTILTLYGLLRVRKSRRITM